MPTTSLLEKKDAVDELDYFLLNSSVDTFLIANGMDLGLGNYFDEDWDSAYFDPVQNTYVLKFKSTEGSKFTVKHKQLGEVDADTGDLVNGSQTDSIDFTGSYGDKLLASTSHTIKNTAKTEKITGSDTVKFSSTNATLESTDDVNFAYKVTYKDAATYSSAVIDPESVLVSKNSSSTENFAFSGDGYQLAWSRSQAEVYKYNPDADETVTDKSTTKVANFLLGDVSEERGTYFTLKLNAIINQDFANDVQAIKIKALTVSNADFTMLSSLVSITESDAFSSVADLLDGLTTAASFWDASASPPELAVALDTFNELFSAGAFSGGKDTITINSADGVEISGWAGNDVLIGNTGDDVLIGGSGSDTLTGAKGADSFVFGLDDFDFSNAKAGVDTITDFKPAEGDSMDLGDLGGLAFYATLADAKADEAALFYSNDTGSVYYDNDVDDVYSPVEIIKLTGKPQADLEMGFDQ